MDNIAWYPAADTPNCLVLKFANPDLEIDLLALSDPVLSFFFFFFFPLFCFHALSSAFSLVKSENRKVVVTPQVFKE